jgi:uncharacterized protein YcgL (UPF0745 family)
MKKLMVMLLTMGLLGLLSLGTVAYADDKDDKGDKDKQDHKKVVICDKKDHKFKLIEVKLDEVKEHLHDDGFFPKGKVLEEDKDKAIVKFVCDSKDKKDDRDKKDLEDVKVLICEKKDHKFKLIEVKLDEVKKHLRDDGFFPKDKVLEEDKDKAIVKFVCDFKDKKDDKKTIYPFQEDKKDHKDDNKAATIGMRQTALAV